MKAKLHWLLSLPRRLLRSIFGGIITVEWTTASELVADETQGLILAELRKQTNLLEVLAKQGEYSMRTMPIPFALEKTSCGAAPCAGCNQVGTEHSGLPG